MKDYDRIARVIQYLDEHRLEQPTLSELAEHAGLSQHHFHRLFARWAGITPKAFLQCLTVSHARKALRAGSSVLDSALNAGLSGPGRLHDLCVNLEAASPGEVKSGGEGWLIRTAFVESPFGSCLVGESPRGICHLSFVDSTDRAAAVETILLDWPSASIKWDRTVADRIDCAFSDAHSANPQSSLRAVVKGTEFQIRVWRALLHIPCGTLTSYGQLAESLGAPRAARAVGSAIGQNRLAWLIPCHRVIRETGVVGEYRWGAVRKKTIVAWETASHIQELPVNTGHPVADVDQ